jgi:hypothetical protein
MVAILSNQIKTKNMKQELITRIRCILNFMEEFETLVSNAKKKMVTKNGKTSYMQGSALQNPT